MKQPPLSLATLPFTIKKLRTALSDLRFEAPGIWPLSELSDQAYDDFFDDLQVLAKDCLAMQWDDNLLPDVYFIGIFSGEPEVVIPELIRLTRELLCCCDTRLIWQYRELRPGEYETIRLLEQTHAQLIGAYYGQRPGEETLDAQELIFR